MTGNELANAIVDAIKRPKRAKRERSSCQSVQDSDGQAETEILLCMMQVMNCSRKLT